MIANLVEHTEMWLSLREAALLTGKCENTVKTHRDKIRHRRKGYGSRAPLYFHRKSLLKWVEKYNLPDPKRAV